MSSSSCQSPFLVSLSFVSSVFPRSSDRKEGSSYCNISNLFLLLICFTPLTGEGHDSLSCACSLRFIKVLDPTSFDDIMNQIGQYVFCFTIVICICVKDGFSHQASNGNLSDFDLTLQDQPLTREAPFVLIKGLQNHTRKNGMSISLRCEFRGNVRVDIEWFRNEAPIQSLEGKIEIIPSKVNGSKLISRLKIKNLDIYDTGLYKCLGSHGRYMSESIGLLKVDDDHSSRYQSLPDFDSEMDPEFPAAAYSPEWVILFPLWWSLLNSTMFCPWACFKIRQMEVLMECFFLWCWVWVNVRKETCTVSSRRRDV